MTRARRMLGSEKSNLAIANRCNLPEYFVELMEQHGNRIELAVSLLKGKHTIEHIAQATGLSPRAIARINTIAGIRRKVPAEKPKKLFTVEEKKEIVHENLAVIKQRVAARFGFVRKDVVNSTAKRLFRALDTIQNREQIPDLINGTFEHITALRTEKTLRFRKVREMQRLKEFGSESN